MIPGIKLWLNRRNQFARHAPGSDVPDFVALTLEDYERLVALAEGSLEQLIADGRAAYDAEPRGWINGMNSRQLYTAGYLRGHTDARRAAGITPPKGELPAGWPRSASMKEAPRA